MTRGRSTLARFHIPALIAAGIALGIPALPSLVVAAPAENYTADLIIYPPAPCTADTVTLLVRGFVATPCDSFLSVERYGLNQVRIITQVYSTRECFAAPFQFYSVPIVMGRYPAGRNQIMVERKLVVRDEIGHVDTTTTNSVVEFFVDQTCQSSEFPAAKLPFVLSVTTAPDPACPGPVSVHLEGLFPSGCGQVVSVDPGTMSLVIAPYVPRSIACTVPPKPWSADLPLGSLAAGRHHVRIQMTVLGSGDQFPSNPTQRYVGDFTFDVPLSCGRPPLPYVDFIRIQAKSSDPNHPICPADSVEVIMGGKFPSNCFHVDSLVPLLTFYPAIYPPPPPTLLLSVSDQGCSRRVCGTDSIPWQAAITLPPQSAGDLKMGLIETRTLGCPPVTDSVRTLVPFNVGGLGCPPPVCGQLVPDWLRPGDNQCNAYIRPGDTASVVLTVRSPQALAGLQGTIHPAYASTKIVRLEPIGVAANMRFSWIGAGDGSAHFVMYDTQGASIPASSTSGVPVLRVTISLSPTSQEAMVSVYTLWDMLGSTEDGQAVPMCPPPPWALMVPPTAYFCVEKGECDFNADGGVDVRDLVLMVRCINGLQACPPEADTRYDCDNDAHFGLNDVVCCAMELLRGPACPNCPVDTVRAAPEVAVGFGAVRELLGGLEVPLRIEGASSIGGARLRIHFPDDRYVVTGVGGDGRWMEVYQENAGEMSLGLIHEGALTASIVPEGPLEVKVRLALRAGMSGGGEMRVLEGDFSGRDGVRLAVNLGAPVVPLGPSSAFALSVAPNPFEGSTRLSVQLAQPGTLDVGIYDLAGRRVATIFHGQATAGVHPMVWDGHTEAGEPAPRGVYFARAATNGQAVTRRLVMLSGRIIRTDH